MYIQSHIGIDKEDHIAVHDNHPGKVVIWISKHALEVGGASIYIAEEKLAELVEALSADRKEQTR